MKKLLFILTLGVFVLSGCGQKGPLYLPEPEAETSATLATPQAKPSASSFI